MSELTPDRHAVLQLSQQCQVLVVVLRLEKDPGSRLRQTWNFLNRLPALAGETERSVLTLLVSRVVEAFLVNSVLLRYASDTRMTPSSVRSALAYLDKTLGDVECDLCRAAAQARMSKFHLSRLITQFTGYGWRTHIRGLRLLRAIDLLLQRPDLSMKETAGRCGYANTAAMDHEFQRWLHMTPGQYRRLRSLASEI